MWWTIIAIIGFILFKFLVDMNTQKTKMKLQGGIKSKYSTLIKLLLSGDSRTKIYNNEVDTLMLGLEVLGGYTKFELTQTFGKLTIQYTSESNIYGKNSLMWQFDENYNQENMYEKICSDIAKQNQNLF